MSTPSEISNKWVRRIQGASEDIRKGVQATTEAPSARAIAKKDKFVAELMKAINNGDWERGLANYTLEMWKKDMLERGVGRIGQGAEAAKADFEKFMAEFLPYVNEVVNKAKSMPDLTLDDRINKAIFVMRELSKFKRK